MIPPTTNELRQYSDNLANIGKNLNNLKGAGRALTNAAVVAVALVIALSLLPPMFTEIV